MLFTKLCGNRSAGSEKEEFKRVFTIYASCDHHHVTKFSFQYLKAYIHFF